MASFYTLTFLLKEGESIGYHSYNRRHIAFITHDGMEPEDAMADTIKRLILGGFVNDIYEITGLTKEGDVEIYGGYRCPSSLMPKKTSMVTTGWNYIRSLCYTRCFLFGTDFKKVVEAALDWWEDGGILCHKEDDGKEWKEKLPVMDYVLEREGPYYGEFLDGLYRNSAVMEAALLGDAHLISLYREDQKTLPPVRKQA